MPSDDAKTATLEKSSVVISEACCTNDSWSSPQASRIGKLPNRVTVFPIESIGSVTSVSSPLDQSASTISPPLISLTDVLAPEDQATGSRRTAARYSTREDYKVIEDDDPTDEEDEADEAEKTSLREYKVVREMTSSDEELTSAREPPLPITVARKASTVVAAPSKENDATQTSEREEQPPLVARSVLGDCEDERAEYMRLLTTVRKIMTSKGAGVDGGYTFTERCVMNTATGLPEYHAVIEVPADEERSTTTRSISEPQMSSHSQLMAYKAATKDTWMGGRAPNIRYAQQSLSATERDELIARRHADLMVERGGAARRMNSEQSTVPSCIESKPICRCQATGSAMTSVSRGVVGPFASSSSTTLNTAVDEDNMKVRERYLQQYKLGAYRQN